MDQQKRQKNLIIVLAVVIIFSVAMFVFNQNKKLTPVNENNGGKKVIAETVNLEILNSSEFKELEKIGDYPVKAIKTKKSNPFSYSSLE